MNYRNVPVFIALFLCYGAATKAQSLPPINQAPTFKPALFKKFPSRSECRITEIDPLFTGSGKVSIAVSESIVLKGVIVASVQQDQQVQSINIKLDDYPGALFTVSRIHLEDGTLQYTGRMISSDHSDALVLTRENGKYYFTKIEQRLLVPESPQ